MIGSLEARFPWGHNTVCPECYSRLQAAIAPTATPMVPQRAMNGGLRPPMGQAPPIQPYLAPRQRYAPPPPQQFYGHQPPYAQGQQPYFGTAAPQQGAPTQGGYYGQPPVFINVAQPYYAQPTWSPGLAAVMSFFIPGLGQLYKGQIGAGIAWMVFTILGYCAFFLPGLVLHIACIVNAASARR